MDALAKMVKAGFTVSADGDKLKVKPLSKLTEQQRAFLKEHRNELLKELRGDDQPAAANDAKHTHIYVCCGDCRHSVLPPDTEAVCGWRMCGLDVEGGGGFGRADRRCTSFVGNPAMEPEALEERAAILQYDGGLTRQESDRAVELMKEGWALWNAVARAQSDFRAPVTIVVPPSTAESVTTALPTRGMASPPSPPVDMEAIYVVWTIHYADGTRGTVRDNEGGMNYTDALQYATTHMTGVIGVSHN
jgi:hypothetical protein